MPYIQFDEKAIHVQVSVGALEEYKPNKKIQRIVDKVAQLRKEMDEFINDVVNPEIESIKKMVNTENKKHQEKIENEKAEQSASEEFMER